MNTWHKFTEELPPKDGRYLTVTNANLLDGIAIAPV